AGLVIAMVDVPLFVNAVEVDLEDSAVAAGWVLSALTGAMAITSALGGRLTERSWYRPPLLAGVALSTAAFAWMGLTWDVDGSYAVFALQLALLGAGFGLTVAPTTSAVVDAAPPQRRGSAASTVMVVRLLGLSVGLSALTAWGLARFAQLRTTIDLPPLSDPGFEDALLDAQASLTAQAIAETFLAAAVVVGAGLAATFAMRRTTGDVMDHDEVPETRSVFADDPPVQPAELVAPASEEAQTIAELRRRTDLLVGALGVLLVGAFVLAGVAFWRLASTRDELAAAQADLVQTRDDLERVEAGAALYASQITGFQELLTELQPQVSSGLDEAIAGLEQFGSSTLTFDVGIDEEIPISTEIVIDREVVVPIETSIPINESFDTTIRVETPLGFSVPLDVTVPVDIEVPVDLDVTIPVNETVPIEEVFPVQLDVPIEIDVGATELGELTRSLAAGLAAFRDVLDGLGEGPG
ncbi:MAG: MFS transporter, partial [Acidimicrobiales bacterium]|nr:MFS transporter [Acidimicrobiales bacterium]